MSWSLASLLALAVALACGFAWYERSRPSARTVAVAATLAALAILGRIAFAPLPNVKPTTDIVLIAGYTLGGAPGFAVGAVTALVSNLFFGQGPWTPWQMAGWGLVGIFGALLARASSRRLGRIPLALACAIAGLLYGALLDLSVWVTFTGQRSAAEYVAIAGVSLPFNLAHAVGNFVFFMAFGPALIRTVERCRARFEIRWQPVAAGAFAALVVGAALAAPPAARAGGAADAAAYLERSRNGDGGWGGAPGQASNGLHTAWATYALVAAGREIDVADLLVQRLGESRNLGDLQRTILGLAASGADPRAAGGRDLVAEMLGRQRPNGSFGGYVSYTSYGILALVAADDSRGVAQAARWLARQANRDGGFNVFRRGGPSNADDTAGAIEALVAAGRRDSAVVRRAARFLVRAQRRDGGYALSRGAATNAQSTAFAVLGLVAAGVDPARVRRGGRTPLGYLRRLQRRDGSVRYSRSSAQTPVWVTAQALLALERAPLPVRPAPSGGAAASPAAHGATAGATVRSAVALLGLLLAALAAG